MAQKDKSAIFKRAEVFCLPVGTVHTWDSAGVLVSVLVLIVLYCCRTAPCCMRGDSNTAALCWFPLHSGAWLSLLCWPNLRGIMLVVAGNSAKGGGPPPGIWGQNSTHYGVCLCRLFWMGATYM